MKVGDKVRGTGNRGEIYQILELHNNKARVIHLESGFEYLVGLEDLIYKGEDNMSTNKITITLNGSPVLLDIDRARELGLIEEVKKELIERSGKHCKYYTIRPNGILDYHYEDNSTYNSGCYDNGDYFSSDKVAQAKIDQCLGLTGRIQAYILEENERTNWVANWEDDTQNKYYITYSNKNKRYEYHCVIYEQDVGIIYTSKEIAYKLRRKLNEGWR